MSIVSRFSGRALIDELLHQPLVRNDQALAEKIAEKAEVREFAAGDVLIEQGDADGDLHFILFGDFSICVNNRRISVRAARDYVGEMSFISPNGGRAATVIANANSVTARISEDVLTSIANNHPWVWRALADRLVQRLRDRNEHVRHRNDIPSIFVASSSEHLDIATAIASYLRSPTVSVELWAHNVFGASDTAIESLEAAASRSDFAIAVIGPCDIVRSRGRMSNAPRDNVIFELGLFMGALKRDRTFAILPRGENVKIPTDLSGVTFLQYAIPKSTGLWPFRHSRYSANQLADALRPALDEVLKKVGKKGSL